MTADCHAAGAYPATRTYLLGMPSWPGHNTVAGWHTSASTFRDIFDGVDGVRTGLALEMTNTGGSEWMMQYFGYPYYGQPPVPYDNFDKDDFAYGTRSSELAEPPFPRYPVIDNRYKYGGTAAVWGLDYNIQLTGGIQEGYHRFPCSKCHTPHASRLERLMRTNCLDNGTAGDYCNDSNACQVEPTGSHTLSVGSGTVEHQIVVTNLLTMDFEAVNCHSVASSTSGVTYGGWNDITPW